MNEDSDHLGKGLEAAENIEHGTEVSAVEVSAIPDKVDFERVKIEIDPVAAGFFLMINQMIDEVLDANGVKGDDYLGPSVGFFDKKAGLHFAHTSYEGGAHRRIVEKPVEGGGPLKPVYVFESFDGDEGGVVVKFRAGPWTRALRHLVEDIRDLRSAPVPVGRPELVKFGSYMGQPLLWRVYPMSEKRLAVADCVVDAMAFDEDAGGEWEDSSLRAWLDEEFSYLSFTTEEWGMVSSPPGLFLLDEHLAETLFENDHDRIAWPTAWAASKATAEGHHSASTWWLSAPSKYGNMVVTSNGRIYAPGTSSDREDIGVRPAFYLVDEWAGEDDE